MDIGPSEHWCLQNQSSNHQNLLATSCGQMFLLSWENQPVVPPHILEAFGMLRRFVKTIEVVLDGHLQQSLAWFNC